MCTHMSLPVYTFMWHLFTLVPVCTCVFVCVCVRVFLFVCICVCFQATVREKQRWTANYHNTGRKRDDMYFICCGWNLSGVTCLIVPPQLTHMYSYVCTHTIIIILAL